MQGASYDYYNKINATYKAMADKHKAEAERQLGKTFSHWNPKEYQVQGQSIFIRVEALPEALDLILFKDARGKTKLTQAVMSSR